MTSENDLRGTGGIGKGRHKRNQQTSWLSSTSSIASLSIAASYSLQCKNRASSELDKTDTHLKAARCYARRSRTFGTVWNWLRKVTATRPAEQCSTHGITGHESCCTVNLCVLLKRSPAQEAARAFAVERFSKGARVAQPLHLERDFFKCRV